MPIKTFSEDQFNKQYATDSKADLDPFTGVETYSQRMAGKTNTIPKLTGRPFGRWCCAKHRKALITWQICECFRKSCGAL